MMARTDATTFPKDKTLDEVSGTFQPPLYNARIISTYLRLIQKSYSHINVNDLLDAAGMEIHQVEDEGHWFTQDQVDRFHRRLIKLTGNEEIAREAGRFAMAPEMSGLLRQYVLGFIGPAKVYDIMGKKTPGFTKSSTWETKKVGRAKVEISVTVKPGVHEQPYQCQNRMGYIEAVAETFNHKLPRIEHPECVFDGGKACRYVVSWKELKSSTWRKFRDYSTIFLILANILSFFLYPHLTFAVVFPLSTLLILLLTIVAGETMRKELTFTIENLRASTETLLEQSDVKYNNALLVNEIGLAIGTHTVIEDILDQVVQVLEKRLDYDRGMILLANNEKTRLEFKAGYGYTHEQSRALQGKSFHLDKHGSKGAFVVTFKNQEPFIINDVDDIRKDLSPRSVELMKAMGTKSFICCPISSSHEPIGILAVDNVATKRPLLQSDINLLMGVAPQIAVAIRNARLLEARERQFNSILQVLATSIDARDSLTAGHSENVTQYAVGICQELNLPRDYCEMIRVAALLHDYGKIGVKDDILKKAGALTNEEYLEIKKHAAKTQEILEKINFEGIYKEVPFISGCHHEKFDGTGYPLGLTGPDIPLGARILAVADVFEAITAKRHYREPMPLEDAFKILTDGCGRHFDTAIVQAFVRYYQKEFGVPIAAAVLP